MIVKIQDKEYITLNTIEIKKSSKEVTFSDIDIDFSNGTIADIPIKYQEVQILDDNKKILFYGYVNTVKLPDLNIQDDIKILSLNLLSPLKLATNKMITLKGTYNKTELITKILEPLTAEDFVIKELNVDKGVKTVNYISQTIEYAMNDICNSLYLWWYIDAQKQIYVNSLDYMYNKQSVLFNENNKILGMSEFESTVNNSNYYNTIYMKNARVLQQNSHDSSSDIIKLFDVPITLKQNDTIQFKYPVIIDKNTLKSTDLYKYYYEHIDEGATLELYGILIICDFTREFISLNVNTDEYTQSSGLSLSTQNRSDTAFVLNMDNFYTNMATGLTYKGPNATTVLNVLRSDAVLVNSVIKSYNNQEIEKCKNKVCKSGIVESTIDLQNCWYNPSDLITIARSLLKPNSNNISSISFKIDRNDLELDIGTLLKVDYPALFCEGKFVITDINYSIYMNEETWKITAENTDTISSYIDIFRPVAQQEADNQLTKEIIVENIDENIIESHEIYKDEN